MATIVDREELRFYIQDGADRIPVICTGAPGIKHSKETFDVELDADSVFCVKCGKTVTFVNPITSGTFTGKKRR